MRRYLRKFLLPFYTFSLKEEMRDKLNPYKKLYPGYQDNLSPEIDSLSPQPQDNYPSETYDSILQSEIYQLPEEQQEEILNHFSNTNIFPSQFDNSNLNPEPIEEEQMDMLTPEEQVNSLSQEQQIENAIDEIKMTSQDPYAEGVIEDSNLPAEQASLEELLDDPLQQNDLMNDMEMYPYPPLLNDQFLFNPFFFNGHMF